MQFAVCTLQAARSGHENKLNYIERNGTGLEVAGLAGLDGIGFEFEEGGKPQMAASPSGGRGKERLAGRRVQVWCKCAGVSGAGCQYLQNMDTRGGDKVVPELCKRIGEPGSPGLSKVCRRRLGLGWVMDEKWQAHLSSAAIWARFDCGNSRRRSERETVKLRQEPQKTTAALVCSNRATWRLARMPRSLIEMLAEDTGR